MALVIQGNAGDNVFIADGSANEFNGGGGNDTVSYQNSTAAVVVRLDEITPTGWWPIDLILNFLDDFTPDGVGGYAQGDDLTSIENVTGSLYSDRLYGNRFANTLTGLAGDDALYGNGGDDMLFGNEGSDQLFGGDGNDTLFGGEGGDRLDGGTGFDVASYRHASAGVFASLGINYYGGEALGDTYFSIEALEGSAFRDMLIGGDKGDTLVGLDGNDELFGHGGTDALEGGSGDDVLDGGDQNDALIGGIGNDSLSGGNHDDVLLGGTGNDWLSGGNGNDSLNGGAGTDVLEGGDGQDLFVLADISGHDTITDFVRGQDKVDLRAIDAIAGGGDDAFIWIGSSEFSGVAGQLRVFTISGGFFVAGDVDGDASPDFTFGSNIALMSGDFFL